MKRFLIAAALAFAAGSAMADLVARSGKDYVRITDTACAGPVLSLIPENAREHFRTAYASIDGKDYAACWALRPDGMVVLQYSDGDQGLLRGDSFRQSPGV